MIPTYRWWRRAGVAAAVACGACCAVPLIAVLSGVGVAGSLGAVFAVFERVSIVLAVVALTGAGVVWLRRHRHRACTSSGTCRGAGQTRAGPATTTVTRPATAENDEQAHGENTVLDEETALGKSIRARRHSHTKTTDDVRSRS